MLERCIGVEHGAAETYERLADRFSEDRPFRDFWLGMAADEREHAHKLSTWRALLELTPENRHPAADGFEADLLALENLVRDSEKRALQVFTADEAFRLALALEMSELDTIYTTLVQSSPIKRFADIEDTRHHELGRHHEALIRENLNRSKDEKNLYDAELLTAEG